MFFSGTEEEANCEHSVGVRAENEFVDIWVKGALAWATLGLIGGMAIRYWLQSQKKYKLDKKNDFLYSNY